MSERQPVFPIHAFFAPVSTRWTQVRLPRWAYTRDGATCGGTVTLVRLDPVVREALDGTVYGTGALVLRSQAIVAAFSDPRDAARFRTTLDGRDRGWRSRLSQVLSPVARMLLLRFRRRALLHPGEGSDL